MSVSHPRVVDLRMRQALDVLQEHIRSRYPDAGFTVTEGEDPEGIHLIALLDIDEPHELFDDAFCDLLLDLYGEDGLPLYVFATWPLERARKEIAKQIATRDPAVTP